MKQNIVLSNELIKIRSDKGPTLATLAFQIFHGGNSTFIKSFDKTKLLFHSSTDVVPQFLKKQEIHLDETFSTVDHALKIGERNSMHRALTDYFSKCVVL